MLILTQKNRYLTPQERLRERTGPAFQRLSFMENEWLLPFKELISVKTGLRINGHVDGPLAAHIRMRTSQLSLHSTDDYYRLIASDTMEGRDELKGLVTVLAIGESYFFRDKGQFRLLRDVIIPDLIRKRSNERELRLWSAGCSSGEEPYSLAMLMGEVMQDKDGWRVSIIGTDIREDFLEKARAGVYGDWSFRQVDEEIKKRYFRKKGAGLALDPRIKEMVSFFPLDLMEDNPAKLASGLCNLDLILCRNVFIYYDHEAVMKMLSKMTAVLDDGGYLMTAHGELFSVPPGPLEPRAFPESVVYEKMERTYKAAAAAAAVAPTAAVKDLKAVRLQTGSKRQEAKPRPKVRDEGPLERPDGAKELRDLFKRGLYSMVIEKAVSMLGASPGDFHLLYLSGAAYANTGDLLKAKEQLHGASKADPFAPEPYYLLALIAEQEADREAAKEALNKAVYLKNGFVAAYIELASIHEFEGGLDKARRLRLAALDTVRAMPADSQVEMCEGATAGEIADYLSRLTGA